MVIVTFLVFATVPEAGLKVKLGAVLSILKPVLVVALLLVFPTVSWNSPSAKFSVTAPLPVPPVSVAVQLVPLPVMLTEHPVLPAPVAVAFVLSARVTDSLVVMA